MTDTAPLMGLRIHLDRTRDTPCSRCGQSVVVVAPGTGVDTASLRCAICDRYRGSLPSAFTEFLAEMVSRFGRPSEPITIRNSEFARANAESRPAQKPAP